MIITLKKFFSICGNKQKRYLICIIILSFIGALLEMISLGLLVPIIGLLNNETLANNSLVSNIFTSLSSFLKKFNNNEPLVYTRSYIDIGDSKVVLDRSISQSNMWNALRNTNSKTITLWSSDNPNVSTIQTIDDGKLDEYKVLKRSVENSDSFFGYSEFSRIAETKVSLQYDVPKIFGFRQLARFREEDSDTIIGLERYYIYSGDTLDLNDKPLAIIKSKIIMKRE
jgi:hypothetical protein